MRSEKKDAKAFTHGGKFHADDVFSTALLLLARPDLEVQRGFAVPEGFDGIVYDIGAASTITPRTLRCAKTA